MSRRVVHGYQPQVFAQYACLAMVDTDASQKTQNNVQVERSWNADTVSSGAMPSQSRGVLQTCKPKPMAWPRVVVVLAVLPTALLAQSVWMACWSHEDVQHNFSGCTRSEARSSRALA